MGTTNDVQIFNRFEFITKIAGKLRSLGCSLAISNPIVSVDYRYEGLDPTEYAILGPKIDSRKKVLGLKIGPKPRSKVLCIVNTHYYANTSSIFSIKFRVLGQNNLDLVNKIVTEIYDPSLRINNFIVTVVQINDEYEYC